jgi:hypothetical protein
MNNPVPTSVNATLTITVDGTGTPQGVFSGSSYVNAKGDLTLNTIKGPIQVTITISTTLQICYCIPAAQTMLLGLASAGPPQGPYSGPEFSTPTFPTGAANALQWTDQNSDGQNYTYALLVWQVNSTYPQGRTFKIDPRIINRGTSK